METITNEKINEIIDASIDKAAFSRLAKLPEEAKKDIEEKKKSKSQVSQDVDDALFGNSHSAKFKLNENIEVSNAEIESFKEELSAHLAGHSISYDTQENNGNETIADFHSENGTMDVIVSGKIDDSWLFTFSLKNGLTIKTEAIEITDENRELIPKLYNLHKSIFKTKFSSMLS